MAQKTSYRIAVVPLLSGQAPNTHAAICLDPVPMIVDKDGVRYVSTKLMSVVYGTSRDDALDKLSKGMSRYHDLMLSKHRDMEFTTVDVTYDDT